MRKLHEGAEAVVTKQNVLTLLTSIQFDVCNLHFALGVTQLLMHNGNSCDVFVIHMCL